MYVNFNKKKFKKMGAVVLVACICVCGAFGYKMVNADNKPVDSPSLSATTNWGLSFQQEGQRPVGNATIEELAKNNAYYCADTDKKVIYLTFDCGYENGYMKSILDTLKEEKVPATFFVVGTYIRDNPDLIKRMVKENHIVGNHTMTHPDMSAISDEASFKKELSQVEELYKDTTGKKMEKFYRPPQGKFSISNLQQAKGLGYTTVFWSLAYVDWYVDNQPSREEALNKLMPRTHNGAIILLHSTSKTNAKILKELITNWKEDGYQFKSLKNLGKL